MTCQRPIDEMAQAQATRRDWLAVLARAGVAELDAGLRAYSPGVRYEFLRHPERGMVMLRGRMGGSGEAFNLGEASVTRCTVRLLGGLAGGLAGGAPGDLSGQGGVGSGHVLGRDRRKAELVAVFDALLQAPDQRARLEPALIAPLRRDQQRRRAAAAADAASSKVEFFTLVRGQ